MFKIGEKAVCIDHFEFREDDAIIGNKFPVKNEIYTIRGIFIDHEGTYLVFEELINPFVHYADASGECQFNSAKFRKLDHQFAEDVIANIIEKVREESLIET